MATATNNNKGFIAGLLTATAASLCCITPLLAFLGGATGLASSFSWIEPSRPYLIGLTLFVFAFAWFQKLNPQIHTDCNCETGNTKSFAKDSNSPLVAVL
jgi:mercuric ion transport protein